MQQNKMRFHNKIIEGALFGQFRFFFIEIGTFSSLPILGNFIGQLLIGNAFSFIFLIKTLSKLLKSIEIFINFVNELAQHKKAKLLLIKN